MGNEYKNNKEAAADLEHYVNLNERYPFHILVRKFYLKYGFGESKIKKMLREAYPDYEVRGDEIRKVEL